MPTPAHHLARRLLLPALIAATAMGFAETPSAGDILTQAELQVRLEQLEDDLSRERESLQETLAAQAREREEREQERSRLAEQVLSGRIELEAVRERRTVLERQQSDLDHRDRALREAGDDVTRTARSTVEQLTLGLDEVPMGDTIPAFPEALANPASTESATFELDAVALGRLLVELDSFHARANRVRVDRVSLHTADGTVEPVDLLSAGYAAFAYRTVEKGRTGVALTSPADASGYRWTEDLDEDASREIETAAERPASGEGGLVAMPMDVTRSLRADGMFRGESLQERIRSGGPIMYPLAGIALLALILVLERIGCLYIRNARKPGLVRRVLTLSREGGEDEAEKILEGVRGVVPQALSACLKQRKRGTRAMEDAVQEELLQELPGLRRYLSGLAVLAAVAPLLGLLGTVTGIIRVFAVIRSFGNANPGFMAGGISEALVTTVTGLVIAIPVLLLRSLLRGRMEALIADAERHAASLLNTLARGENRW